MRVPSPAARTTARQRRSRSALRNSSRVIRAFFHQHISSWQPFRIAALICPSKDRSPPRNRALHPERGGSCKAPGGPEIAAWQPRQYWPPTAALETSCHEPFAPTQPLSKSSSSRPALSKSAGSKSGLGLAAGPDYPAAGTSGAARRHRPDVGSGSGPPGALYERAALGRAASTEVVANASEQDANATPVSPPFACPSTPNTRYRMRAHPLIQYPPLPLDLVLPDHPLLDLPLLRPAAPRSAGGGRRDMLRPDTKKRKAAFLEAPAATFWNRSCSCSGIKSIQEHHDLGAPGALHPCRSTKRAKSADRLPRHNGIHRATARFHATPATSSFS